MSPDSRRRRVLTDLALEDRVLRDLTVVVVPYEKLPAHTLGAVVRLRAAFFGPEEGDPVDQVARHAIATDAGGGLIAAARLIVCTAIVRLERVIVRDDWRRHGVGRLLLGHVRDSFADHDLIATVYGPAQPFYEALGFVIEEAWPAIEMRCVPARRQ